MSDTIDLIVRVHGEWTITVDRARYEQAKADGEVDHYLDSKLSNLDGDNTVTEPNGRTYDPFKQPYGPDEEVS